MDSMVDRVIPVDHNVLLSVSQDGYYPEEHDHRFGDAAEYEDDVYEKEHCHGSRGHDDVDDDDEDVLCCDEKIRPFGIDYDVFAYNSETESMDNFGRDGPLFFIQRLESDEVIYKDEEAVPKLKYKFLPAEEDPEDEEEDNTAARFAPRGRIGERKYIFGDKLGEGSYGKVKEVMDCHSLERRAVKILSRRKLRRIPHGESNVQIEIRLLRRLSHVNVIGLKDVYVNKSKQKIYLVLEYCVGSLQDLIDHMVKSTRPPVDTEQSQLDDSNGPMYNLEGSRPSSLGSNTWRRRMKTLRAWRKTGSGPMLDRIDDVATSEVKCKNAILPYAQTQWYIAQLLQGLLYLHSVGVVHKDIKPGNLLVTTSNVIKISDFGVAQSLDPFSPHPEICMSQGSPVFQPPEVANGLDSFDGIKVDVWSSGVTIYNMVTGSYPFEGDTVFLLFESIGQGRYIIPPHVPPIIQDVIHAMLKTSADERASVHQILKMEWFRTNYSKQYFESPRIPQDEQDAIAQFPAAGRQSRSSVSLSAGSRLKSLWSRLTRKDRRPRSATDFSLMSLSNSRSNWVTFPSSRRQVTVLPYIDEFLRDCEDEGIDYTDLFPNSNASYPYPNSNPIARIDQEPRPQHSNEIISTTEQIGRFRVNTVNLNLQ